MRATPRPRALPAALLAPALAIAGCGGGGGAAPPGSVVVVEVPAPAAAPLDVRDPHPPGSRVALWSPTDPERVSRVLSADFYAAGAIDVAPELGEVLFCGKRVEGERWGVFRVKLDGAAPIRVTSPDYNALSPVFVAGGRIVFSADLEGEPDPRDGRPSLSLYRSRPDGSELTRISFNPGSDIDPTLLPDGRLLHSAWQGPAPEHPDRGWALFTLLSDGTALMPFYGSHSGAWMKRRPRALADGRVVFATCEPTDSIRIELESVALRRPLRSRERPLAGVGGDWRSLASGAAGELIGAFRPHRGAAFDLYASGGGGEGLTRRLYADPERDLVDALPLLARVRRRGHVSDTRPGSPTGTLLCLDARRTDRGGGEGERRLAATRVRIIAAEPGAGGPGADRAERTIAELDLAADGSFVADVPADLPLRFETLDAEGALLLDSHGWVWVRPGEQRSCIGCHADREAAPDNRLPLALWPGGEHGGVDGAAAAAAARAADASAEGAR